MKMKVSKEGTMDLRENGLNDISIGGVKLLDLPEYKIPWEIFYWFEKARRILKLQIIRLFYIPASEVKRLVPSWIHVGSVGRACLNENAIVIIQSDDGIIQDKHTIIHELLHFKLGPHNTESDRQWKCAERELYDKMT
jgi:hypothetical protein